MPGVTYDTGALLAAERNDRRMWALHAGLLAEEVVPVVPAPALAEAWRGGARQAGLSRLLLMCDVEPMTEEQARRVGVLAGNARHDDVVDVTVVEGAIRRADAVVTSDEDHIRRIAELEDDEPQTGAPRPPSEGAGDGRARA
jgi:predicted nucleic acid-binding protein